MKHNCELLQDSISHLPKLLPNDSNFAKLRRKISKLFLVSINHPEIFSSMKSSAAVEKESKRQADSKYFIIHPLSEFRKFWDIIIFFVAFSHQFLTAYIVGFFMDLSDETVSCLIVIDTIICVILWIEIIISFRTGFIADETNEIILNPKRIARKYAKHFIPDSLTSLPYILIITLIHLEENNYQTDLASIVSMLILFALSIYRFGRFHSYFSSIPNIMNLSDKTCVIFTTFLRSFFLLHWTSSVRKLLLFYVGEDPSSYENNVWREPIEISKFHVRRLDFVDDLIYTQNMKEIIKSKTNFLSNYTVLNEYTRSIMITLKLSLQAGYGAETSDSILNMLITSFIMFTGWVYCTYVLILMSNIIFASAISKNKFQEIMNDITVFSASKGLSAHLNAKMRTYVERKFEKRYFNEEAINMYVQSTAACLKKEIMMHSCSHLLSKVPLFKDLPLSLLENIISCLTFEIYFPNEIIIEANAIGISMYFIAYGKAEVISKTGHKVQTLQDGSYFGEIALLIKGQKRTATVKSMETCELYKLSQRDFRKVIEPHHDVLRKIEEIAKDRLRNMYMQEFEDRRKSTVSK